MNFAHGPVVVDQVFQTMAHGESLNGFIPKGPRVAIKVANKIDAHFTHRFLLDIDESLQRFAA